MKPVKTMVEFSENYKSGKKMVLDKWPYPVTGDYSYEEYVQLVKDGKILLASETVTITYPKPETKPLKVGQRYWTPVKTDIEDRIWDGSESAMEDLKAGMVWLIVGDAIAFLKAISEVSDE